MKIEGNAMKDIVSESIVYLIDDDASIRKALALALSRKGFNIKTFETSQAFLNEYQESMPSCLVLDIKMPKMTGLELQKVLIEKNINIPVIFITGHGDVPASVQAFKAGAIDFLEKPFDQNILIQRIGDGLKIDCERLVKNIECQKVQKCMKFLTPRESEVLKLLVSGKGNMTNKEIGSELSISFRTVEIHRKSIMLKLECSSFVELIEMMRLCNVL